MGTYKQASDKDCSSRMRVLYDHQIFTLQRYGGISRYFCELMEQVSAMPDHQVALSLRCSANAHLRERPQTSQYCSGRLLPLIGRVYPVDLPRRLHINLRESERVLARQEFDVFHPTYYNPYFQEFLGAKPFVLTVHDMIHEIFAGELPGTEEAGKAALIEAADAIIAISESTKEDIVRITGTDPSRITIIHHGNPLERLTGAGLPALKPAPGTSPYLLFVGDRAGYKNFAFFIRSVAGLLKDAGGLHVCCAGGPPFTAEEKRLFGELGIAGRVTRVQGGEATMVRLYRGALAFVFPSRYEGFGLPILEAFSCGCPAVISNTSSLPEVGGDAALSFDPQDTDSVQGAIRTLLDDPDLAETLRERGYRRLSLFSWEKTAAATAAVYESVSSQ